jgi:hypothetical protein
MTRAAFVVSAANVVPPITTISSRAHFKVEEEDEGEEE